MTIAIQLYNKEIPSEAAVWLFSKETKALSHLKTLVKDEFFHNPGELSDFMSTYGIITQSGVLEHSGFKILEDEDEQINYLLNNLSETALCELYNTLSSELSFIKIHRDLDVN